MTELSGKEEIVRAPMAGRVLEVHVKPGDSVKEGDLLLIFEAMKMENEIYAPISGIVKEVRVTNSEQLKRTDPLVIIANTTRSKQGTS